jgi:hypothetical protein
MLWRSQRRLLFTRPRRLISDVEFKFPGSFAARACGLTSVTLQGTLFSPHLCPAVNLYPALFKPVPCLIKFAPIWSTLCPCNYNPHLRGWGVANAHHRKGTDSYINLDSLIDFLDSIGMESPMFELSFMPSWLVRLP